MYFKDLAAVAPAATVYLRRSLRTRWVKQLLLVMRLTAILLIAFCLHVAARTHSQTVSFSGRDVPLENVFNEIKKQTGFNVVYNYELISRASLVTVDAKDLPLKDFLQLVLKERALRFSIESTTILIEGKPVIPVPMLEEANPPITGIIRDVDGNPIAGVNVVVKGTRRGVTTDANGKFSIEVAVNEMLVISSVGYNAREVKVETTNVPHIIALDKSVSQLDEVQYIAYGTQSKRYSVGNVTSIKAADIEKQPVTNALFALQGRVPGVLVTQNTGFANGAFTVQIQGRNSIARGSNPLIVVDGVPLPFNLLGATSSGGPLNAGDNSKSPNSPINFINPADIEAIDILKDADATAIYGSRAANGAILITTKKGKPNKTKISVGFQQGWSRVGRKVDMLNTRQYLDMRYESIKNEGLNITSLPNYDLRLWDTTRYTNWQKELIGSTAKNTNVTASVSGGTGIAQYLVGAALNSSTNVFPGSFANKTGNIHFNISAGSLDQRFKLSLTGSYAVNNNKFPDADLTKAALLLAPNAPPLYNEDGTLNWAPNAAGGSTFYNPLGGSVFSDYEQATNMLTSNAQVSYSILPGLSIKSSFGYNNVRCNSFFTSLPSAILPEDRDNNDRNSQFSDMNSSSWIAEPQLTFNKTIGKISLDALAGSTFQKEKAEVNTLSASGFINDLLVRNISSATFLQGDYLNTIYRYSALFGRLNVIFDRKYITNVTTRRDGSSRFGENNLFHNFWSAGAGWIFTEEKVIGNALPFLSFGKLRGSYGTTGSDGIGDYQYLNSYFDTPSDLPYQGTTGLGTYAIGNPYLQWEETRKLSGGIDLGFFKERVLLNITYQRNRSSNQLLDYPLPSITGVYAFTKNLPALVQNTSWELSLKTDNIKTRDFSWSTNVNLTIPRNKVIDFPGIEETSYANGMNGVIVGQPLGVRKYYHYLGIDPASGFYTLANENKQPLLGLPPDLARNVLISTQPAFYGGLINTLTYKGFSLDFVWQFVRQRGPRSMYFWNELVLPGTFFDQYSNQPVSVLNRWQQPGDNNPIQKFTAGGFASVTETDAYFSWDASYLRLKNVSFSWEIPSNWCKKMVMQSGILYFRGQNLATISRYTGLDPETQNSTVLPPLQVWTAGITIML